MLIFQTGKYVLVILSEGAVIYQVLISFTSEAFPVTHILHTIHLYILHLLLYENFLVCMNLCSKHTSKDRTAMSPFTDQEPKHRRIKCFAENQVRL